MWLFIWPTYACMALPQSSGNFPAVHHSIVQWDPALLDSLRLAMLVRSVGNSMLIRPDEQDVVGVLEALVEYMCSRGWREVWACQVICSKAKSGSLHRVPFTNQKEAQLLVGLWVWGQHVNAGEYCFGPLTRQQGRLQIWSCSEV